MARATRAGMTKLFFVLALAGCLDSKAGDPAPQSGVADFVPLDSDGSDCAGDLDACYKSCQAAQPSPTERCFQRCDLVFYRCIPL
jgi:hypothetical protein